MSVRGKRRYISDSWGDFCAPFEVLPKQPLQMASYVLIKAEEDDRRDAVEQDADPVLRKVHDVLPLAGEAEEGEEREREVLHF